MCSLIFHQHLFFVPFAATICLRPSQIYFNKSLYLSRKEQPLTSMVSHGFGLCPRPGFDFWNLILSLCPFFPGNKIFRLIWGLWTPKFVFCLQNYAIYWWVLLPDFFHQLVCFPITWKNLLWVAPLFHLIGPCHTFPFPPTMTSFTHLPGGLLM